MSLRYLSTPLTACCLFQTKRSYHEKTVKCAIFSRFLRSEIENSLSNPMSRFVFSAFFLLISMDLDTPGHLIVPNLSVFCVFFERFEYYVYVNCRLE